MMSSHVPVKQTEGEDEGGPSIIQIATSIIGLHNSGDINVGGNLEINVQVDASNSPKFVTSLPPCDSPPQFFTGRQKFLEDLHTALFQNCQKFPFPLIQRMAVLTGLGGIGKTSLALEYALQYKDLYQNNVAWIQAETAHDMIQSFQGLAHHFQICSDVCQLPPKSLDETQVATLVREVYAHFSTHVKVGLFIFDNAHHMRSNPQSRSEAQGDHASVVQRGIQTFLTREKFPNLPLILVTSQNNVWGLPGDKVPIITLTPMDKMEGIELVRKIFGLPHPPSEEEEEGPLQKALEDLCELLGGYPLALSLAASSISETMSQLHGGHTWVTRLNQTAPKLTAELTNYMTEFEHRCEQWVTRQFSQSGDERYDKIMANVWTGTIKNIQKHGGQEGKMALEILNLIAYLPNTTVTLKLCHFIYHKMLLLPRNLRLFTMESLPARQSQLALGLLERYSMVSLHHGKNFRYMPENVDGSKMAKSQLPRYILVGGGSGRIGVHRLVQKWALETLRGDLEGHRLALEKLFTFHDHNFHQLYWWFDGLDYVQINLKRMGWPCQVQNKYMAILVNQMVHQSSVRLQLLKDVYSPPNIVVSGEEEMNFNLWKMALILCRHWKHDCDLLNKGMERLVDNSDIFDDPKEPLRQICLDELLDFVLSQVERYQDHYLVQDVGAHILTVLVYPQNFEKYLTNQPNNGQRLLSWMRNYNRMIRRTRKLNRGDTNLHSRHFINYALLTQMAGLSVTEVVEMIVRLVEEDLRCIEEWELDSQGGAWEFFVQAMETIDRFISLDAQDGPIVGRNRLGNSLLLLQGGDDGDKSTTSRFVDLLIRLMDYLVPKIRVILGSTSMSVDIVTPTFEIIQVLALDDVTRRHLLHHEKFLDAFEDTLYPLTGHKIRDREPDYYDHFFIDQEFRWSISAAVAGLALFSGPATGTSDDEDFRFAQFLEMVHNFSREFVSNVKLQKTLRHRIDLCLSIKMEARYKRIAEKYLNRHTPATARASWQLAEKLTTFLRSDNESLDHYSSNLVPLPPPNFAGRSKVLEHLDSLLNHGSPAAAPPPPPRIVVITGVEGMGKTVLAQKYAIDHYHHTTDQDGKKIKNVFWLQRSQKTESFKKGFHTIARQFGIDPNAEPETSLMTRVYRHFSLFVRDGLFIFDDAHLHQLGDGSYTIEEFLPQENLQFYPSLLITSRTPDNEWTTLTTLLSPLFTFHSGEAIMVTTTVLGPLSGNEGREYFCKSFLLNQLEGEIVEILENSMEKLTQSLSGYPRALEMAVSHLKRNLDLNAIAQCPPQLPSSYSSLPVQSQIQEFVEKLEENGKIWGLTKNFEDVPLQDFQYFDNICALLWNLGIDHIFEREKEKNLNNMDAATTTTTAAAMLQIMAYLPVDFVSVKWCHFIHHSLPICLQSLVNFKVENGYEESVLDATLILEPFKLLERHGILRLETQNVYRLGDIGSKSVQALFTNNNNNGRVRDFFVRRGCGQIYVSQVVQKWMRMGLEINNNFEALEKLGNFYENNYNPLHHNQTSINRWPCSDTYLHSFKMVGPGRAATFLHFGSTLYHLARKEGSVEATKVMSDMIQCPSKYFRRNKDSYSSKDNDSEIQVDYENLDTFRMALLSSNKVHNLDKQFEGMGMEDVMDNSNAFQLDKDPLARLRMVDIHAWVLERLRKYRENQLMQEAGTAILRWFVDFMKEYEKWIQQEEEEETRRLLVEWVGWSFETLLDNTNSSSSGSMDMRGSRVQTFLETFKPTALIILGFSMEENIQIIVRTTQVQLEFSDKAVEAKQRSWLSFFEKIKAFDVWKSWLVDCEQYAANASEVKTCLVESGGLILLERCFAESVKTDNVTSFGWASWRSPIWELLDIFQELARSETVKSILLASPEFGNQLQILRNILLRAPVTDNVLDFDTQLELTVHFLHLIFALWTNRGVNEEDVVGDDSVMGLFRKKLSTFTNHSNFTSSNRWRRLVENRRAKGKKILETFLAANNRQEMDTEVNGNASDRGIEGKKLALELSHFLANVQDEKFSEAWA